MSNPLTPPKAGDTVEFRGRSWIVFKWVEDGGIAVISLTGGPKDSISIPWASLPRPESSPTTL